MNSSNISGNPQPTQNGTGVLMCDHQIKSQAAIVGQIACYCLIMVLSLCGNGMVTTVIYRSPRMRTTTNYFIANMAISDLLVPIFVLPNKITLIYTGQERLWLVHGDLGNALCKFVPFFQDVSLAVSIQSLVVIAVDRFFAVVFPLRRPVFSMKRCPLVIAATWLIATVIHSPYFYILRLVHSEDKVTCEVSWEPAFDKSAERQKQYLTFLLTILIPVPLTVIIVLYSVIAYDLSKKSARQSNYSDNARQRREKENKNVVRMLVTVVAVFVVSFTPQLVFAFILFYALPGTLTPCTIELLPVVTLFFFHANGAVNPMVYFIYSENYRHGLKSSLGCCFFSCPRMYNRPQRRRLSLVDEFSTTRTQASLELNKISLDMDALNRKFLDTANGVQYKHLTVEGCYNVGSSASRNNSRDERNSVITGETLEIEKTNARQTIV